MEREQLLAITGASVGLLGWLLYHLTKNESYVDPNENDNSSIQVYGL
jgi:hypothetical protein